MSNRRTGNYNEYVRLLNKYKSKHPMEKWDKESSKKEIKNRRTVEYIHLSESIMDSMKLKGTQRRDLKHLIRTVPLKSLHRRIKVECIILCLCIYVRRSYDSGFRWQQYGIVKRYGLTCDILLTVVSNLCIYYSRKVPLPFADDVNKYGEVSDYNQQ